MVEHRRSVTDPQPAFVDEEAVATRERSRAATVIASCIALACVAAGLQFLVGRLGRDELSPAIAVEPASTSSTTAKLEPLTPLTTQESTDAATSGARSALVDRAPIPELALGEPLSIAFGNYETGDTIVDLLDGSARTLEGYKVLAITEHYLVALSVGSTTVDGVTSLSVVDRSTGSQVPITTDTQVWEALPGRHPDQVWLWGDHEGGYQLELRDLAAPDQSLQRVTQTGIWWPVPRPGHDPYLTAPAVGVYELTSEGPVFVDQGEVLAAAEGAALWRHCDDEMVCATTLRTNDTVEPVEVPWLSTDGYGGSAMSSDSRYVVLAQSDRGDNRIYDRTSGRELDTELSNVWFPGGYVFAGNYLITTRSSSGGIGLIDLAADSAVVVSDSDSNVDSIVAGPLLGD